MIVLLSFGEKRNDEKTKRRGTCLSAKMKAERATIVVINNTEAVQWIITSSCDTLDSTGQTLGPGFVIDTLDQQLKH